MNADEIVGQKIKTIRMRKNMSLNDVALRIGKSRYTVRNYEEGRAKMFWTVYLQICRVLDIDPVELSNEVQREVKG